MYLCSKLDDGHIAMSTITYSDLQTVGTDIGNLPPHYFMRRSDVLRYIPTLPHPNTPSLTKIVACRCWRQRKCKETLK